MWAMENLKINALFWSRRNKIWSALVCAENKWDESRAEGKQLLTTGGTTHCVCHKYSSSLPLTWPVQEETTSCHRPSGLIHLHWSFHDVQTWFWVPFCSLFVFLETISQQIRLSVWIKIYSAVKTNTAVSISHKQSLWILTVNKYISGCSSTVGNGCSFEGVHSTKETPCLSYVGPLTANTGDTGPETNSIGLECSGCVQWCMSLPSEIFGWVDATQRPRFVPSNSEKLPEMISGCWDLTPNWENIYVISWRVALN